MPQIFNIALDIADPALNKEVFSCLAELEGVRAQNYSPAVVAEKKAVPHLVIFYLNAQTEGLLDKIRAMRQTLSQAAIFVISTDKSPDHVVEVMKAGADEFFTNPLNASRLKEAVGKARQQLANLFTASKGSLYSFISAKGGLGATVISVNTAAALAMKSEGSVALLDMSLQSGDSSVYLDTLPHTTLADICRNFHRLDFSFLKASMLHLSTGLHYLAAPKEPEDIGLVQGPQVQKVLQLAKNVYDHVVVDCTSMLVDECSLETFGASDRIFLLTDLSVPALRNTARLNQLLQKLKIPPQKIEVVVNRFTKSGASLNDVEKNLHKKIFWLFPNEFEEVIASINAGIPLVKNRPSTIFARNVFEFVEKLKNPERYPTYRGAKGLLGKVI